MDAVAHIISLRLELNRKEKAYRQDAAVLLSWIDGKTAWLQSCPVEALVTPIGATSSSIFSEQLLSHLKEDRDNQASNYMRLQSEYSDIQYKRRLHRMPSFAPRSQELARDGTLASISIAALDTHWQALLEAEKTAVARAREHLCQSRQFSSRKNAFHSKTKIVNHRLGEIEARLLFFASLVRGQTSSSLSLGEVDLHNIKKQFVSDLSQINGLSSSDSSMPYMANQTHDTKRQQQKHHQVNKIGLDDAKAAAAQVGLLQKSLSETKSRVQDLHSSITDFPELQKEISLLEKKCSNLQFFAASLGKELEVAVTASSIASRLCFIEDSALQIQAAVASIQRGDEVNSSKITSFQGLDSSCPLALITSRDAIADVRTEELFSQIEFTEREASHLRNEVANLLSQTQSDHLTSVISPLKSRLVSLLASVRVLREPLSNYQAISHAVSNLSDVYTTASQLSVRVEYLVRSLTECLEFSHSAKEKGLGDDSNYLRGLDPTYLNHIVTQHHSCLSEMSREHAQLMSQARKATISLATGHKVTSARSHIPSSVPDDDERNQKSLLSVSNLSDCITTQVLDKLEKQLTDYGILVAHGRAWSARIRSFSSAWNRTQQIEAQALTLQNDVVAACDLILSPKSQPQQLTSSRTISALQMQVVGIESQVKDLLVDVRSKIEKNQSYVSAAESTHVQDVQSVDLNDSYRSSSSAKMYDSQREIDLFSDVQEKLMGIITLCASMQDSLSNVVRSHEKRLSRSNIKNILDSVEIISQLALRGSTSAAAQQVVIKRATAIIPSQNTEGFYLSASANSSFEEGDAKSLSPKARVDEILQTLQTAVEKNIAQSAEVVARNVLYDWIHFIGCAPSSHNGDFSEESVNEQGSITPYQAEMDELDSKNQDQALSKTNADACSHVALCQAVTFALQHAISSGQSAIQSLDSIQARLEILRKDSNNCWDTTESLSSMNQNDAQNHSNAHKTSINSSSFSKTEDIVKIPLKLSYENIQKLLLERKSEWTVFVSQAQLLLQQAETLYELTLARDRLDLAQVYVMNVQSQWQFNHPWATENTTNEILEAVSTHVQDVISDSQKTLEKCCNSLRLLPRPQSPRSDGFVDQLLSLGVSLKFAKKIEQLPPTDSIMTLLRQDIRAVESALQTSLQLYPLISQRVKLVLQITLLRNELSAWNNRIVHPGVAVSPAEIRFASARASRCSEACSRVSSNISSLEVDCAMVDERLTTFRNDQHMKYLPEDVLSALCADVITESENMRLRMLAHITHYKIRLGLLELRNSVRAAARVLHSGTDLSPWLPVRFSELHMTLTHIQEEAKPLVDSEALNENAVDFTNKAHSGACFASHQEEMCFASSLLKALLRGVASELTRAQDALRAKEGKHTVITKQIQEQATREQHTRTVTALVESLERLRKQADMVEVHGQLSASALKGKRRILEALLPELDLVSAKLTSLPTQQKSSSSSPTICSSHSNWNSETDILSMNAIEGTASESDKGIQPARIETGSIGDKCLVRTTSGDSVTNPNFASLCNGQTPNTSQQFSSDNAETAEPSGVYNTKSPPSIQKPLQDMQSQSTINVRITNLRTAIQDKLAVLSHAQEYEAFRSEAAAFVAWLDRSERGLHEPVGLTAAAIMQSQARVTSLGQSVIDRTSEFEQLCDTASKLKKLQHTTTRKLFQMADLNSLSSQLTHRWKRVHAALQCRTDALRSDMNHVQISEMLDELELTLASIKAALSEDTFNAVCRTQTTYQLTRSLDTAAHQLSDAQDRFKMKLKSVYSVEAISDLPAEVHLHLRHKIQEASQELAELEDVVSSRRQRLQECAEYTEIAHVVRDVQAWLDDIHCLVQELVEKQRKCRDDSDDSLVISKCNSVMATIDAQCAVVSWLQSGSSCPDMADAHTAVQRLRHLETMIENAKTRAETAERAHKVLAAADAHVQHMRGKASVLQEIRTNAVDDAGTSLSSLLTRWRLVEAETRELQAQNVSHLEECKRLSLDEGESQLDGSIRTAAQAVEHQLLEASALLQNQYDQGLGQSRTWELMRYARVEQEHLDANLDTVQRQLLDLENAFETGCMTPEGVSHEPGQENFGIWEQLRHLQCTVANLLPLLESGVSDICEKSVTLEETLHRIVLESNGADTSGLNTFVARVSRRSVSAQLRARANAISDLARRLNTIHETLQRIDKLERWMDLQAQSMNKHSIKDASLDNDTILQVLLDEHIALEHLIAQQENAIQGLKSGNSVQI